MEDTFEFHFVISSISSVATNLTSVLCEAVRGHSVVQRLCLVRLMGNHFASPSIMSLLIQTYIVANSLITLFFVFMREYILRSE